MLLTSKRSDTQVHIVKRYMINALRLCVLYLMATVTSNTEKRQLMVIMIDGARWDYVDLLEHEELGGFKYFKYGGVRVEYAETVYPSNSYPAWTTLSTGLYPESHGIIGNSMYDRECNLNFLLGSSKVTRMPIWWSDVESIWTTATKAGLKVATIEWSRSDVPYHGILPEVATGYKASSSKIEDKLQEAFVRIEQGFDLVMVYYDKIDSAGHAYGAASDMVMFFMKRIGAALDGLFEDLIATGLDKFVDIIMVSDHGMASFCSLPSLNISKYINVKADTQKVLCEPALVAIFAKPGLETKLHRQLRHTKGYNVKFKHELAERYHYKSAERAPDILLYPKRIRRSGTCKIIGGIHGFDPKIPDMRGMFLAYGRSFIGGGKVLHPINIVDVYQLYCYILNIDPMPNNGSWNNVKFMIRGRPGEKDRKEYLVERKAFTRLWDERFVQVRLRRFKKRKYRPSREMESRNQTLYSEFLQRHTCW